jgi:hypothetical protein
MSQQYRFFMVIVALFLVSTLMLQGQVQYTASQFLLSYPAISDNTDIVLDVPFVIAVEEPFVFTGNYTLSFHTDPNNPSNARVELGSGAVLNLRVPTLTNTNRVIAFYDSVRFSALPATKIIIGDGVSAQHGRLAFYGTSSFVQVGGVQ